MSLIPRKRSEAIRACRHHARGARDAGRRQDRQASHVQANQGVREGDARAERVAVVYRDGEGGVRAREAVQLQRGGHGSRATPELPTGEARGNHRRVRSLRYDGKIESRDAFICVLRRFKPEVVLCTLRAFSCLKTALRASEWN